MLAVYQSQGQWQAGVLRIDEVAQYSNRESWCGIVAALELADDHRDCNALRCQDKFELSSTQVLYSEMLTHELTVEQIRVYQKAVNRLGIAIGCSQSGFVIQT